MAPTNPDNVDVLIVGSGPTGLALALDLAVQGVSFRIIDKAAARTDKSRSLAVQPRTLELLNRHDGAGGELQRRGFTLAGTQVNIYSKVLADVDLDEIKFSDSRYSRPLLVPQYSTEAFLDEYLARHGHRVERPVEALKIVQDAEGVTTTVARPVEKNSSSSSSSSDTSSTSTSTIRSKYVVGCDGAHSLVRHSTKITFQGAAYPQEFILCDGTFRGGSKPPPHDRVTICLHRGILILFPLPNGVTRIAAVKHEDGPGPRGDPTVEDFQKLVEELGWAEWGTVSDPVWLTRYRLHHRRVDTYREGRLFVAGDAAHIHSPIGGQGMNTGIQDAINLAWKLGAVLRGETQAPEALLDSYDAERRPIAQEIIQTTDNAFSYLASTGWLYTSIRNFSLPWVFPWVAGHSRRLDSFRFTSELNVGYRQSSIVGTAEGFTDNKVVGGDRLPDAPLRRYVNPEHGAAETTVQTLCSGPGHHLLLFAADGKDASESALEDAAEKITRLARGRFDAHFLYTNAGAVGKNKTSSYVDPDGKLHDMCGFGSNPGYAYVRPDGYFAHIGPLGSLEDLLNFLKR